MYPIPRNIFIQYFSREMLKNYGLDRKYEPVRLANAMLRVARICYLLTGGKLLIPTIDLVESPHLSHALPALKSLLPSGELQFVGSEVEPNKFIGHKQTHFGGSRLYPQYFEDTIVPQLETTSDQWIKRAESTTHDLTRRWQDLVELTEKADADTSSVDLRLMEGLWQKLRRGLPVHADSLGELYDLPERLDGEAFLWDIVEGRGLLKGAGEIKPLASLVLGMKWLQSHLEEFDAAVMTDLPLLNWLDCGLRSLWPRRVLSYAVAVNVLRQYDLADYIFDLPFEWLQELRRRASFLYFRETVWLPKHDHLFLGVSESSQPLLLFERFLLDSVHNRKQVASGNKHPDKSFRHALDVFDLITHKLLDFENQRAATSLVLPKGDYQMTAKVFLVHSWNAQLKNEVHVFLVNELQLSVVVMDASPMGGRTLPEKFEATAQEASFAVVLITADEKITKEDGSSIWRIRPNVLLEIGYFWGKLGRKNLAILIERASEIEIPTDLAGIGYLPLSGGFSSVKFELLKELRQAGVVS